MSEERLHHPFSPSTLQYRESCAYYASQHSDNAASQAGTRQHAAVEEGSDLPTLTDNQAAAVAACLEFAETIAEQFPGGQTLKEVYLPIDERRIEGFHGTTGGYIDHAIISAAGTEAAILDWKFGAWAVETAENNLQGMAYALGLLLKFPKLVKITVYFVMPHRDEVDFHTFTAADFPTMRLRVETVVDRAVQAKRDEDFAKATPNVGACLFCANKAKCVALTHMILTVGKKFAPLKVPADITPSLLNDPTQVGLAMKVADVVGAWAKAYRSQATEKAVEDEAWLPEGYDLVSGTKRVIKSVQKVRAVAEAHLTRDEVESAMDISLTPLEDLISAKAPRGEKTAAKDAFDAALREAGAVEDGKPYAFLKLRKK